MYIEILDAAYEDMESLTDLDVINTIIDTTIRHYMLRIAHYKMYWKYNWWLQNFLNKNT